MTIGTAPPVDRAAPDTGLVNLHFFRLRVGLEDELASGTTAWPSRRGCKFATAENGYYMVCSNMVSRGLPFESTESAEAECMAKNDSANNVKECVHEGTFIMKTLLAKRTTKAKKRELSSSRMRRGIHPS